MLILLSKIAGGFNDIETNLLQEPATVCTLPHLTGQPDICVTVQTQPGLGRILVSCRLNNAGIRIPDGLAPLTSRGRIVDVEIPRIFCPGIGLIHLNGLMHLSQDQT